MTDFLTDIYNKVMEIVNSVGSSLDTLVNQIDSVQFNESSTVTKAMGMVRYFVKVAWQLPMP